MHGFEERSMIVVCGEALMDVFPAGPAAHGLLLDARVGGSPFNVAVGLARLGQPVAFFGGLSTDFAGDRLLLALREEGVATEFAVRLDAPTALSLVGVDAQGQPSYSIHTQGAADRLLPRVAAHRVPPGCRALHVGSYAVVVEPVAATLRALVERECMEAFIAYDPNVRLAVEPDRQRWREAVAWMARRADLLKVSHEDLALLYPGADPLALLEDWLAQGVSLVVLTQGARGALAVTRRARVQVDALPCEVVDTVGAGDTFQAALLAWLAEHAALSAAAIAHLPAQALRRLLAFACRAAAITCERRGADLPRRAELPAASTGEPASAP
jgi:fructokinase